MDLDRIREILQIVSESGVAEVEVEDESFRMVVRQHVPQEVVTYQAAPAPAPQSVAPAAPAVLPPSGQAEAQDSGPSLSANEMEIHAPIVGTFYAASSPDAEPYVTVGTEVRKGDVLCIIEAMKLMNEIESEVDGIVKRVLVENAQPVQYDEALFVIEAS